LKPTNALLIYSICDTFLKSLISEKAAVIDSEARLVEDTFDFGTEDPAVLSRFIENQSNVENTIYHGLAIKMARRVEIRTHVQNSGKSPALRFDVNFTIPVKYRCSKSAPVRIHS